jgi:hypothetical protein
VKTLLPNAPFHRTFTSLHLSFTIFPYPPKSYTKGEAVKAKKRKLYWGGFLLYFFNFVPKRVKFVPKRVTHIYEYMLKKRTRSRVIAFIMTAPIQLSAGREPF